jgi:ABC-2 type transport system permease protein
MSDALRCEWLKLWSLRSTWITLGVAVVLGIGGGAGIAAAAAHAYRQGHIGRHGWQPVEVTLISLFFVQWAMAVLGALTITGEYGSGMIRSSLAAVPKRARFLVAKAAVLTVVVLVVGEVIAFGSFLLGQAVLGAGVPHASLSDSTTLRAVVGAGLYLTAIGLLSTGLGFLVRSTAAAIAIVVGVLFVFPIVFEAIPVSWLKTVDKWWPTQAGAQIYSQVGPHASDVLGPWAGFGVLCAFVAVVLVLGYVALSSRNA